MNNTPVKYDAHLDRINSIVAGRSPEQILGSALDGFASQKKQMLKLKDYKKEYNGKGGFGKFLDRGKLLENTNEAVFHLASMSESQFQLQLLVLWMTNEIIKHQDVIKQQQRDLKKQSICLKNNQQLMEKQQKKIQSQTQALEDQGKHLAEQADHLRKENAELIRSATELRELREIGMEHDNAIVGHDKALTGMERFLIELKHVMVDYQNDQACLKGCINDIAKLKINTEELFNKLNEIAPRLDTASQTLSGHERLLGTVTSEIASFKINQQEFNSNLNNRVSSAECAIHEASGTLAYLKKSILWISWVGGSTFLIILGCLLALFLW